MGQLSAERDVEGTGRRGRSVTLHLDGAAWLRVTESELARLPLSVGEHVDEERRIEVEHVLAQDRSREFVVRSLAVRAQTEAEIRRKLAARDVPPQIAAETIGIARRYGFLDDAALAERVALDLRARGYGRRRAERVLRERGVAAATTSRALGASFDDVPEIDSAVTALGRRRVGDTDRDRSRAAAFLIRRGFSPAAAWGAVRRRAAA
ncbi:MAG: RecX family transcriptional regulator [Gaiellales bacterium]